jgi:hypothetical protein
VDTVIFGEKHLIFLSLHLTLGAHLFSSRGIFLGKDPNKKTGLPFDKATVVRFLKFNFGNPAIPILGPVAFRPTITRGLALSVYILLLVI